jgi:chromosome segregation ATPase
MAKSIGILPGVAAFLAGLAAGALTGGARERGGKGSAASAEVKSALARLEHRMAEQESASESRFSRIEAKLEDHAARLADVPSTAQIVSAMEQILARTMSSLDDRLNSQARSIDTLKTTVAQTDSLLERVLESIDSLHAFAEPGGVGEESLVGQRSA